LPDAPFINKETYMWRFTTHRTWNVTLWMVQLLLATVFLVTGYIKVVQPIDVLAVSYQWIRHVPPLFVRVIGIGELLAVAGLLGPAATGILPRLTVFAAVGIMIVMVGAIITHTLLSEPLTIAVNVVLLCLAACVAYGRSAVVPVPPRMGGRAAAPDRR
jgi:hypothetical protein